jgi:hypothetical protein
MMAAALALISPASTRATRSGRVAASGLQSATPLVGTPLDAGGPRRVDGPPPHLPLAAIAPSLKIQPRVRSPAHGRHVLNQPGREDPADGRRDPHPAGKNRRPCWRWLSTHALALRNSQSQKFGDPLFPGACPPECVVMTNEIMTALNKFETALRNAVRRDTMAEMNEEWAPAKLKARETAWAEAKAARVELEAKITEIAELTAENARLKERLGPHGLEFIEIDGVGHYVNEVVRAEIDRLRSEPRSSRTSP